MKVEVEAGLVRGAGAGGSKASSADVAAAILDRLQAHPDETFTRNREAIMEACGVSDKRVRAEWDRLADQRLIVSHPMKVPEGRGSAVRNVKRDVWRVGDGKLRVGRQSASDEPESADSGSAPTPTPKRSRKAPR